MDKDFARALRALNNAAHEAWRTARRARRDGDARITAEILANLSAIARTSDALVDGAPQPREDARWRVSRALDAAEARA